MLGKAGPYDATAAAAGHVLWLQGWGGGDFVGLLGRRCTRLGLRHRLDRAAE